MRQLWNMLLFIEGRRLNLFSRSSTLAIVVPVSGWSAPFDQKQNGRYFGMSPSYYEHDTQSKNILN